MARALVAPVWQGSQPGEPERRGPDSKAATLALVDTARVVGMIEDQVLNPDRPMLGAVALGLYEGDPLGAVAALDALRPPAAAAEALLDLAESVPEAPADVRDDLLTRALARAREVGEPSRRVALLARVADRRFEARQPEKARAVVDDARDVQGPGSGRLARRPRRPGRCDRAGRLAGGPRPAGAGDERGESRGPRSPGRGQRPGRRRADLRPAHPADHQAQRAGRSLRRDRPARSAEGVDLATRAGAPGVAAVTVAAAAKSKASDDPATAKKLLAEAYDRLEPLTGRMVVPSVSMARLLPLAVRVDPDRSPEYLWRAIAARPPRNSGATPTSATLVLARLAALVARYDRDAAKTIFAVVAESARI